MNIARTVVSLTKGTSYTNNSKPENIMTTIEIELYEFHELEESAQERALNNLRGTLDYPWAEENASSLDAFCEALGVKVWNWRVSLCAPCYITLDSMQMKPEPYVKTGEETVTGLRLRTWIINNFEHVLWEHKMFGEYGEKQRRSHIIEIEASCPWTGYCMDYALLHPIREFIKDPIAGTTWEDLILDCLNSWVSSYRSDLEYMNTDEYLLNHIEANNYTFTKNGEEY